MQILDIYLFFRFLAKKQTIFLRFSVKVKFFKNKYFFTFSPIDAAKCVVLSSNGNKEIRLNLGIPKMYNMADLS